MIGNLLKYFAGYLACKLLTGPEEEKKLETKDFEIVYLSAKLDESGNKVFYIKNLINVFKSDDSTKYISDYLKKKLDISNSFILVSYPGANEELIDLFESILKESDKRYWLRDAGERETIWLKQMKVIA